jgi:signal transduction histidine kinase
MRRLHAQRGLTIDINVPAEQVFRGTREDLDEMLGNLIDNACKWAAARVVVSSTVVNGRLTINVDDDGPGLAASRREAVLQRGVRADEAMPGSGLGLAIVRDLAELYGGSVVLEDSPVGGLRTRLELPAA